MSPSSPQSWPDREPKSYSYQFIEKSIRNGILEELEDHAVGPPVGTIRAAGSSTQPARIRRQKFTEEDDRILLNWVQDSLRKGGRTEGNEIYKQLEAEVCNNLNYWIPN